MSLSTHINHFLRYIAPQTCVLGLLLLSAVPLRVPGFSYFVILLNAMAIYYWCIYNPRLFPGWFVFLLGMVQDLLYNTPLGVNALCNLLLYLSVLYMRRWFLEQSFIVLWLGFALYALLFSIVKGLIFAMLFSVFFIPQAAVMQWLLSVAFYPCIHWLFSVFYKMLPEHTSHA